MRRYMAPPWHGQAPSRDQLRLMLQALLECICLNNTKDAVHQARQALGHCLTEAQLLAYPSNQAEDQTLDGEERKRKLSKITQQAKTPSSKNSTQVPKSEQPQGQPDMSVPTLANSPAIPPQASTLRVPSVPQNIAHTPKIEQPLKTAASDIATDVVSPLQAVTRNQGKRVIPDAATTDIICSINTTGRSTNINTTDRSTNINTTGHSINTAGSVDSSWLDPAPMGIVHSARDMFTIPEDTARTEIETAELLQANRPIVKTKLKNSVPTPRI